jgi:peptidoglycan/xylan/chitin deacetylase (PgdA/CDA1 family)
MSDMASGEFEFGAHTVSHPHLTRLDRKAQVQEIGRSVGCLEKHLGRRPKAFAYPHGDVDQIVESAVIDAGFESAYAAHPGTATPGRTNPFRIPRIQLDASDPAVLEVVIAIIKLSKYMPRLARPVLSRFFGAPFEI